MVHPFGIILKKRSDKFGKMTIWETKLIYWIYSMSLTNQYKKMNTVIDKWETSLIREKRQIKLWRNV